MSGLRSEGREPGARRKKLAGYLKAANELRQSYQQSYTSGWSSRDTRYEDVDDGIPGAFPDAAIVRSGDEEMILFPSYSRKHIKKKPQAEPGAIQEASRDEQDVRDTTGTGDAEFWRQQWDIYEDDNAVVDVDVRGWIYSPHKGQMSRKNRLFVGLARQLVGIQAPPAAKTSPSTSEPSSRNTSPHTGHGEKADARAAKLDEELASKEAESILKKGEKEAAIASNGEYSEIPVDEESESLSTYNSPSRGDSPMRDSRKGSTPLQLTHVVSNSSLRIDDGITPVQKRASWNQPADMNAAQLQEANARLMARLKPFMANPLANIPISAFFYNDELSKQRTVYTNAAGHFNIRAALDFVPTHVRVLASEKLSATEDVIITEPKGVSLISDIDDTIKHSAIGSGAREIFRNAFIRELGDLTIEGVKEWYTRMAEMGVKFHYVSNSPWQLYPVLKKFFSMAGLPAGSFHLKQYSGMLQGIFEPVAERKKSTLNKIARDFPERSFILVGDSGEADLEVYTEFVLENPGRVLGVFIRDVTTPVSRGFFDSSMGPLSADNSSSSSQRGNSPYGSSRAARSPRWTDDDDDPEIRAAIAASLRDMEEEHRKSMKPWSSTPHDEDTPAKRPQLPPRKSTTQSLSPWPQENLIDFSDDEQGPHGPSPLRRVATDGQTDEWSEKRGSVASTKSMPPMPPRKPVGLRIVSGDSYTATSTSSSTSKPPPPPKPKPRRLSTSVHTASSLNHQNQNQSLVPNIPPKPCPPVRRNQQSYTSTAGQKLSDAYDHLPAISSYLHSAPSNGSPASASAPTRAMSASEDSGARREKERDRAIPPPPPPPRRGITAYPAAPVLYASGKVGSAWNGTSYAGSDSANVSPYSTMASGAENGNNKNNGGGGYGNGNGHGNGNGGGGYGSGNGNLQALNKKEQLWRQRWARAQQVLGEKGVLLRSWRVGGDVLDEADRKSVV